jgi:hypothetical protein
MSPLLRSGLAVNQEMICSHSPSKGSFQVLRQPNSHFLRSCSLFSVHSVDLCFQIGSVPLGGKRSCCTILHRKDADRGRGMGEITGAQPRAHRNTASCNYLSWCKKRMGSSACATSVNSCCISAGRTPDSRRRLTWGLRWIVDVAHFSHRVPSPTATPSTGSRLIYRRSVW